MTKAQQIKRLYGMSRQQLLRQKNLIETSLEYKHQDDLLNTINFILKPKTNPALIQTPIIKEDELR